MSEEVLDFDAALLRLKGELKVRTDKEVAKRLGMSPTAFNDRKKRRSFPEDRVRALASKEFFDADYVVTGLPRSAREMIHAARSGRPMRPVAREEHQVLDLWRACSAGDKALVLGLLARLATLSDGGSNLGNP